MEAATFSGFQGERRSVCLGFSWKPFTRWSRSTSTTPKRETSSGAIWMVASVTSAAECVVLLEHLAVVHLVDVVAGKNEHVLGLLGADGVDVLVNGVGGAHVPVVAHALHGRQDLDELAHLAGHDVPAFADVAVERERLVLGEDVDPAQVGVDAVGERDVDDAVDAAEGDGGFGAVAGEGIEPFSRASSQQDSQRVFHPNSR